MVFAIRNLFGFDKSLGVGPVISDGCYQDLDFQILPEHFPLLEEEMRRIIAEDIVISSQLVSIDEALALFPADAQPYKNELLKDIQQHGTTRADRDANEESCELLESMGEGLVRLYSFGEHLDLCRGPHVSRTGDLSDIAFKLDRVAGAYWRGSEKNPMLCRLYALVFATADEMADHLHRREEAKRRDHRKVGEQQELFFFHPSAAGMAYWLPKGVILKNTLIEFWRQYHQERGYQEIQTPLLNKRELWDISGHWRFYRDDMFRIEDENNEWALKPMNCANAMVVYQFRSRSYRELPLRLSDTDILHRNERAGTLHGLFRARCFCQDDAHLFVPEEQIEAEILAVIDIVRDFYRLFGLLENVELFLSTRPDEFLGEPRTWDLAETSLKKILAESGFPFGIKEGDGAFYGPKIDIHLTDSLGRQWQCGTIQLDFQLPTRFNLSYTDSDGSKRTPIVIHRVIYGSLERFIGILLEHFAGSLPFWISPVQVKVLPVRGVSSAYLDEVISSLRSIVLQEPLRHNALRIEKDAREETLSKRVRDAIQERIPVLAIVGSRDEAARTVALRIRGTERAVGIDELAAVITAVG